MFCFKTYGVEIWKLISWCLNPLLSFPLPIDQPKCAQCILPQHVISLPQTSSQHPLLFLLRPPALSLSPSVFTESLWLVKAIISLSFSLFLSLSLLFFHLALFFPLLFLSALFCVCFPLACCSLPLSNLFRLPLSIHKI